MIVRKELVQLRLKCTIQCHCRSKKGGRWFDQQ